MNQQVIKKGRTGILHLPRLLKKKFIYKQRIAISTNMTKVSDACDSGWNKLWGVSFGHHHWHSSYRFVFRVKDGKLVLGYYAYIDGVSPQDNQEQKGEFDIDIKPRDIVDMNIRITEHGNVIMFADKIGLFQIGGVAILDSPSKHEYATWLITELYPNIKCKQDIDTTFQFLPS